MESEIAKIIDDALIEYENTLNRKINILESKIKFDDKERAYVIKHLKEGNIDLLKKYFGI